MLESSFCLLRLFIVSRPWFSAFSRLLAAKAALKVLKVLVVLVLVLLLLLLVGKDFKKSP